VDETGAREGVESGEILWVARKLVEKEIAGGDLSTF
jgi:hypothetical protein